MTKEILDRVLDIENLTVDINGVTTKLIDIIGGTNNISTSAMKVVPTYADAKGDSGIYFVQDMGGQPGYNQGEEGIVYVKNDGTKYVGKAGPKGDSWNIGVNSISGITGTLKSLGTSISFRGTYNTIVDRNITVTNPQGGDYVLVGTQAPFTEYIYDDAKSAWEQAGTVSSTIDLTLYRTSADQDTIDGGKVDKSDTFTKTEVTTKLSTKQDVLTAPQLANINSDHSAYLTSHQDITGKAEKDLSNVNVGTVHAGKTIQVKSDGTLEYVELNKQKVWKDVTANVTTYINESKIGSYVRVNGMGIGPVTVNMSGEIIVILGGGHGRNYWLSPTSNELLFAYDLAHAYHKTSGGSTPTTPTKVEIYE